ncbi:MAG: trypsin-like peptidase domain-containing protein [Anaerolineae bacterium]|nr:trypsin-like peptidase domain-containing protein [Anaerolineae bacterium]
MIIVLLVATGCVPSLARQGADAGMQAVAGTSATGTATLPAQAEEIVPALYAPTPAIAAASEGRDLEQTLVGLYKEANPSVVYIVVSSTSSGSGFVYGEDGYIITNRHVVAAGSSYEVVFATGERMRATLVGADADSDLAVLQVNALPTGVDPLPLADPESLQVGQIVVAIGNPFGEQGSMSLGIISGLGRSLRSQRETTVGSTYSLPEVIQTDAPINPGNSGGPLLNLEGEVIGVNAAIASTTGASSGVGFSIPVSAVSQIVPVLIEEGTYA